MPYKPKLKSSSTKSHSKPKYKIINWAEYNKSLQKRGELSFYFLKGDLKPLLINEKPYVPGFSSKRHITDAYIELIFTLYNILNPQPVVRSLSFLPNSKLANSQKSPYHSLFMCSKFCSLRYLKDLHLPPFF